MRVKQLLEAQISTAVVLVPTGLQNPSVHYPRLKAYALEGSFDTSLGAALLSGTGFDIDHANSICMPNTYVLVGARELCAGAGDCSPNS